jgi:glycosyltransferase involved in cell wall biosynthesis
MNMIKSEKKEGYSILIASYKMVNFIEECLDSVKNQTYFKENDSYEVLVGIDGCIDTLKRVKEIKSNYPEQFKFYFMKENMGMYITTNTLLIKSNYDKIICFGSDDIMMPKMIEKINKNIGDFDVLKFKVAEFTDDIYNFKISNSFFEGASCYKSSVYDIFGGYKSWRTSADSDFLFRTRQFVKEKFIHHCLCYRRVHLNSLTQNPDTGYNSKKREEYRKQLKYHYDKIEYVQPEINENFEIIK